MVLLLFFGSFHFEAPVLSINCGTPLEFRYLCTAVWGAVPSEPNSASTSSCSTSSPLASQPPRRLDAFRRAVGVVHSEELDLAAVDAALLVQHLEIGLADPPEHALDRPGA